MITRGALVVFLILSFLSLPSHFVVANPSSEQLVQQLLDQAISTAPNREAFCADVATDEDFAINYITDELWREVDGLSNLVSSKERLRFLVTRALRRNCPNLKTPTSAAQGKPSAPQKVSVKPLTGGRAVVAWSRPKNPKTGPLTYIVTSQPGNGTCRTKKLSCTVNKLTPGKRYSFIVEAENPSGSSKSKRTANVLLPGSTASRPTTGPTPRPTPIPTPTRSPKPPAEIS